MSIKVSLVLVVATCIFAYLFFAIKEFNDVDLHTNEIQQAAKLLIPIQVRKSHLSEKKQSHAILVNGHIKQSKLVDGKLRIIGKNTEARLSRGFAFCFHQPGYFLTAHHCVSEDSPLTLITFAKQKINRFSASIIWSDETLDLALLYAPTATCTPIDLAAESPDVNTKIYSYGLRLTTGKIKRSSRTEFMHDSIVLQGDSGSAIVNQHFELLGVNKNLMIDHNVKQDNQQAIISALLLKPHYLYGVGSTIPNERLKRIIDDHQ